MDKNTIYSKTARGLAEMKTNTKNLSREQVKALIMVNGKSSIRDFTRALSEAGRNSFVSTVRDLENMGLVRALAPLTTPAPATARGAATDDDFDLDGGGLPVIEVTELSGEESVQAWAEARRGAQVLQEKGFFAAHSAALRATNLAANLAANLVDASTDGVSGGLPAGTALKALVVEDDPEIVQLLELLLGEKGFAVQTAADIPVALATLAGDAVFDLVLLDVVLPGAAGKDGFHILDAIRKDPRLQQLRVIMVTSQISDEHVLRGLKAGSDGYIFKPFKWDTLYQCIRSVMGV